MASQDLLAEGLLTVGEACQLLRVSKTFLYGRMETGEIPYCRLGDGKRAARRIPRQALREFAARHLRGGWKAVG